MRTETLSRYPKYIKPGVTTRLDLAACYRGYYSDQKFVLCLGKPSAEALEAFHAHRARQELMRQVIRPGVTKEEVYRTCMEKFTSMSEYGSTEEYGFWIHGVGLDFHEEPRVGSYLPLSASVMPEVTFELNTVVALEPSWLVEDTYIVEETGVRCLGSTMTHDIITL